jgi:cytochrome c553
MRSSCLAKASALVLAAASLVGPAAAESVEERAAVCAACHGEDGLPKDPAVPIIWGQHAGYIYIQLRDFKIGTRASEIMAPLVAELEKPDMMAIAKYFSKKQWPRTGYSSPDADKTTGERIETSGLCTECHLGGYVGDGTIPRLSGQTVTYLGKTMIDFKARVRANNPDKSTLIASYPDEDLAAMARYLAGQ